MDTRGSVPTGGAIVLPASDVRSRTLGRYLAVVAIVASLGGSPPPAAGSHARTVHGQVDVAFRKNVTVIPPICAQMLAHGFTDVTQGGFAAVIELTPEETDGAHHFSLIDTTDAAPADFDAWFYRGGPICDPTIEWIPFVAYGDEYGTIPGDRSHVIVLMAEGDHGTFAFSVLPEAPQPPVVPGAVRPGALMIAGESNFDCTLNFVFRDGRDTLYIGTAGHCVVEGETIIDAGRRTIGTVVFDRYDFAEGQSLDDDVALIRIDPSRYAEVEPAVTVWGGPTGATMSDETTRGDEVVLYGHGAIYDYDAATRARRGLLWRDDPHTYGAILPVFSIDSGGPVLHARTGKALGVVSAISPLDGGLFGPTVEHMLELLRSAGWDLEIMTAPYPT